MPPAQLAELMDQAGCRGRGQALVDEFPYEHVDRSKTEVKIQRDSADACRSQGWKAPRQALSVLFS
jgi:hypothetical protein